MRRIHLQADRHADLRPPGARVPWTLSAGTRREDGCQTRRMSAPPLILVVEDNASNQLLVREVLEPAGYHIEVASTASQAPDLLQTTSPALILMHMELPGTDALSLTHPLKRMSPTTATPAVSMPPPPSLPHHHP